jgi:7,8-dihydropterin-6-yl-methyl-4-(beta-D-ribofuranosyl)aminobenzene 5'-phosphate synthase
MKVKIIFDKDKSDSRLETGWGISYLVGNTLFDTGEKFDYLSHNLKILNIDAQEIENIVISHRHWDHLGGLWGLLDAKSGIKVYACQDFLKEFSDKASKYNYCEVKEFQEIDKNIYTSGCLKVVYEGKELLEQALIIKGINGITVICACAHIGALKIIAQVRKYFPQEKLYSVFGGFHLMGVDMRLVKYTVDEMKKIGIKKVGPAHCTGFEAAEIFRQVYGDNFLEIKAGEEFEV